MFDDDEIIMILSDNGMTTIEVANLLGCHYRTAYTRLKTMERDQKIQAKIRGHNWIWLKYE